MCFWQQEYTRDFRSLSKYGADGNLRIRRTKIFLNSCSIHLIGFINLPVQLLGVISARVLIKNQKIKLTPMEYFMKISKKFYEN